METAAPQPAAPRRRAPAAKPAAEAAPSKPARAKKLPKATIETTAEAFMALFNALPGAIKWRIVQKIEEQEEEFEAREFDAARAEYLESIAAEKGIPFEQVMAEYEALHQAKLT
ncbi:hypothetical protein [uncultured Hymenobacter sp.]|uniref:hypothetical protein n=1 Tax=uncultured Hymenobacter sp. TaxID=170016 RepID=UPI0035CA529B